MGELAWRWEPTVLWALNLSQAILVEGERCEALALFRIRDLETVEAVVTRLGKGEARLVPACSLSLEAGHA